MLLTLQDLYKDALRGRMEMVGSGASKVVFGIDDEWVLKIEKEESNYEELFAILDENTEDYDDTIISDSSSEAYNQTAKEILYYKMLDSERRDVLAEIDLTRSSAEFGASVMRRYEPLNHIFESMPYRGRSFKPEDVPNFLEEGYELLDRYPEKGEGARGAVAGLLLQAQEYIFDTGLQDVSNLRRVVREFMDGLHSLYLHAKSNSFYGLDFEDLGARNLGAKLDGDGEIQKIVIIDYGYMSTDLDFLGDIS